MVGPFCTPYSIGLTLASERAVLYGNVAFSVLLLSTRKRYSPFLKKVKLVRTVLETCKTVRNYKHMLSFRKMTFSTKTPLILLMSAFFCKIQHFFGKNSTSTQIDRMKTVLEMF